MLVKALYFFYLKVKNPVTWYVHTLRSRNISAHKALQTSGCNSSVTNNSYYYEQSGRRQSAPHCSLTWQVYCFYKLPQFSASTVRFLIVSVPDIPFIPQLQVLRNLLKFFVNPMRRAAMNRMKFFPCVFAWLTVPLEEERRNRGQV